MNQEKAKLNSVEFSQQQVVSLGAENQTLRKNVKQLTEGMAQLSGDNRKLKEAILDIQAWGRHVNLVFSGIPEQAEKFAEASVRDFFQHQLKLLYDAVKTSHFIVFTAQR